MPPLLLCLFYLFVAPFDRKIYQCYNFIYKEIVLVIIKKEAINMGENLERKFQKRVENFVCEKCGRNVEGTGYTDHCPDCLWSKHIDINPGDRKSKCKGAMEPVGIEIRGGENIIHYQCTECGYKHRVKAASDDSIDKLIELSSRPLEE